jgi:transcriptional regulator with XRE-family HTH domain
VTYLELFEKLKKCRVSSNLTQAQVAELLNVSRKTISGWENGRSYPDTNSLVKMSDIYKISVDDLIRNDHSIDNRNFDKSTQTTKIVKIAYFISVILLPLGYIEFFRPFGIHSLLIPLGMLINEIVFFFNFKNWNFLNKKKMYLLLTSFILIYLVHIFFIGTSSSYLTSFAKHDITFVAEYMLGRLTLIVLIVVNLLILLFFHPYSNKN